VDEVNAKNTPPFSKITLEETRAAHARAAGVIISLTMVAQHESSRAALCRCRDFLGLPLVVGFRKS
jgi:hypothetical protein